MYIFVADWCPHCRAAKEGIFDLMDNYYQNGNLELFEDTSSEYKSKGMKLQVFGVPTFIIVDENEKPLRTWDGQRDYASLLNFYIENTQTEPVEKDIPLLRKGLQK